MGFLLTKKWGFLLWPKVSGQIELDNGAAKACGNFCRKDWNDAYVESPVVYLMKTHGVIEHSQLELKLDHDPGFFWKNIESNWMQWLELSYEFPSNSRPRQRLKLHHLERPWVRRRACSLLALLMSRARHLSPRNQNVADLHNSLADLKIGVFIQVDEFWVILHRCYICYIIFLLHTLSVRYWKTSQNSWVTEAVGSTKASRSLNISWFRTCRISWWQT